MDDPRSVRDVLASLTDSGTPSAPRLTWYGADGERVELSGRVLATWVSKATNLLVELCDAGPGTRVLLDLPVHWRTVVWAMATWTAGATVALGDGSAADADVVVTAEPAAFPTHGEVIAIALPALAMAFDGDLPPGVTDGAAELMSFGDSTGSLPPLEPAAPALAGGDPAGADVPHAGLLGRRSPDDHPVDRVLLAPTTQRELVRAALESLASGGSCVLVDPALSPERRDAIASTEHATS